MAVCRPIGIAARSTYTLSVIVISSFCFSVCFLFVLPCLIAALFGTEHLSVACRDKLFVAMRANLCLNDFATVFSDFLCLSLFSVGFFTLALSCQALLFLLLFLCFYLGKFFFGIGNIHLTDIVKINIDLLCSCFSHTLCFIDHYLINKFIEHCIGDFRRIFALTYQRNEMLNINGTYFFFGKFCFHRFHFRFQLCLLVIILFHQLLILSFGQ